MKKIIKVVTLTGADDSINPQDLFSLSAEFPFVEWGILFSRASEGKPRYPSRRWVHRLYEEWCRSNLPLNFCGHICGRWVRDICAGTWTILDYDKENPPEVMDMFKRFQLNFHAQVHSLSESPFIEGLKKTAHRQFIFQLDNVNNSILNIAQYNGIDAVPLFDLSGGAGVLPEEWPRANGYCGYAGGLSPENLATQLPLIAEVAGDGPIWIDAETRVRSEDDQLFDLEKVRNFLDIAKEWVI